MLAVREQRVEGPEAAVAGAPIARSRIDLQAEARASPYTFERIARTGADGPGTDVLGADLSELAHRLEVPVEALPPADVASVHDVSAFVAGGIEIEGIVRFEVGIEDGQAAG